MDVPSEGGETQPLWTAGTAGEGERAEGGHRRKGNPTLAIVTACLGASRNASARHTLTEPLPSATLHGGGEGEPRAGCTLHPRGA